MGKITVEVYKNTFGKTLYNLKHPNLPTSTSILILVHWHTYLGSILVSQINWALQNVVVIFQIVESLELKIEQKIILSLVCSSSNEPSVIKIIL